jgi:hypothetical protein
MIMSTHANISEQEANLDANRHGLICVIILIIGCLGGITVGYRAIESALALSLVVLPTMTTLSLLLAVAPMKWIIRMATVSVAIDLLVLAYYFFIG